MIEGMTRLFMQVSELQTRGWVSALEQDDGAQKVEAGVQKE